MNGYVYLDYSWIPIARMEIIYIRGGEVTLPLHITSERFQWAVLIGMMTFRKARVSKNS